MQTVLWAIIMIWSLSVFFTIFVDWVKWKPTDEKLTGRIKSVMVYRLKMFIQMIIPAILGMLGAMVVFL